MGAGHRQAAAPQGGCGKVTPGSVFGRDADGAVSGACFSVLRPMALTVVLGAKVQPRPCPEKTEENLWLSATRIPALPFASPVCWNQLPKDLLGGRCEDLCSGSCRIPAQELRAGSERCRVPEFRSQCCGSAPGKLEPAGTVEVVKTSSKEKALPPALPRAAGSKSVQGAQRNLLLGWGKAPHWGGSASFSPLSFPGLIHPLTLYLKCAVCSWCPSPMHSPVPVGDGVTWHRARAPMHRAACLEVTHPPPDGSALRAYMTLSSRDYGEHKVSNARFIPGYFPVESECMNLGVPTQPAGSGPCRL